MNTDYLKREFEIDKNGVLIRYNGKNDNVTIPGSVTTIGNEAFLGCSSLTSITIGNITFDIREMNEHGIDSYLDKVDYSKIKNLNNFFKILTSVAYEINIDRNKCKIC